MHHHAFTRTRRILPATAASLGLAVTMAACGSANSDDASPTVTTSSATTNAGKPGATPALRAACIDTNDKIVSANSTWNKAVDSRKAADLSKASTSMGKLADELREQGKKSGNASFKHKADAVAKKVDTLTKAKTPSKTVDTNTYNDAVDDLTSYCGQMFPSATKKSA